MKKRRLDQLVMERGLAPALPKAQALILAGEVIVDDRRVDKPGTQVAETAELRLKNEVLPYVSRGGLKLKAALDAFSVSAAGLVCADIGASTGGFTDCLLQHGAVQVHAIDVGYAQLHEKLRQDGRVVSKERVNARTLTSADLPVQVPLMVIDVSFISLSALLPGVLPFLAPGGTLIALVKPQFELPAHLVEEGGVVREQASRVLAIETVQRAVLAQGLVLRGVIDSPIAGPAGNVEALLCAIRPTSAP